MKHSSTLPSSQSMPGQCQVLRVGTLDARLKVKTELKPDLRGNLTPYWLNFDEIIILTNKITNF